MREGPGNHWYPFNAAQWEQWSVTRQQKYFPPAPIIPYRLPEIEKAIAAGEPICLVKDEETADLFLGEGVPATCVIGGFRYWQPEYYLFFGNPKSCWCRTTAIRTGAGARSGSNKV
jgi:hypothetical protein